MSKFPEGNAVVYCEGMFGTTCGKTAHGLVRRTRRYNVAGVVDSRHAGQDAGQVLDGRPKGIPIYKDMRSACEGARERGLEASHLVVGLTPDGGRLPEESRRDLMLAIENGLNVDCGLHDYLSEDAELAALAERHGVRLRDVRKMPPIKSLHSFSGKIEEVDCLKIAVLGGDSAIGKRTTAWLIVEGFQAAGMKAELVGTGQTAWMQGAEYGFIMDTMINDFLAGEIEHAVWSAWNEQRPDALVIEGQGSLMNPAYPGGYEILAAGRPDVVVFQYAPTRREYDGFPGYAIHPLEKQIQAIEMVSGKPVVAITINHENLDAAGVAEARRAITESTGLPAYDVLLDGPGEIMEMLREHLKAGGRR